MDRISLLPTSCSSAALCQLLEARLICLRLLQVQSTGGLGRSLPAGQVLGSLYRQQQAAAVAAQQALQGGQESEDDMDEDGGESLQGPFCMCLWECCTGAHSQAC